MEPLTWALFFLTAAGAGVALLHEAGMKGHFGTSLREDCTREGLELGLSPSYDEAEKLLTLEGERSGIPVEIRIPLSVIASSRSAWIIARPRGLPKGLRLLDELERNKLGVFESREDLLIGDPHFDSLVVVQGWRPDLYATLNHRARAELLKLLGHDGFRLDDGELRLQMTVRSAEWLQRDLNKLVAGAKAFHTDVPPAQRLLANFRDDPLLDIRMGSGLHLLESYADSPAAEEARAQLLSEARSGGVAAPDHYFRPLLVTVAACHRPAENLALIERLLTTILAPPFIRVPLDPVGFILAGSVGTKAPLSSAPARWNYCQKMIATALGQLGGDEARRLLWLLTAPDRSGDVRLRAVQMLGRCGVLEDVEPLLELPGGGGWPRGSGTKVRSAVRTAVDAVQSRLEGRDAGRLAVVEEEEAAGGLSVTVGEGALSGVADEETDPG